MIKLSVEDHIKAHLMLAKCFEEGTDAYIHNMRSARVLNKNSIIDAETMGKISETYKGENNTFYGKRHTEESKEKMRQATIEGRGNVSYEEFYGEKSEIEKDKRRKGQKKYWESLTPDERIARAKLCAVRKKPPEPVSRKPLKINDIEFKSIKAAMEFHGVSKYLLFKNFEVIFI